ncbi:MAG TPA: DoxX family protein [Candidatus Kapabacteria bacterium]|jgi:uncharacterized membrane protein YphA (DoxX/SURF4 family)|nr:DoxX family protein [Candidatus Kapabacteria bacterium]
MNTAVTIPIDSTSSTKHSTANRGVGLSIALWSVQVLLAALFSVTGGIKLFLSPEQIAHMGSSMPIPMPLLRFIGVSELLGAIGLIFPSFLRIQPRLTVYAAWGLVMVMILATIFHISRGEFGEAPVTILIGLLAAFVSVGRSKWRPIISRKG